MPAYILTSGGQHTIVAPTDLTNRSVYVDGGIVGVVAGDAPAIWAEAITPRLGRLLLAFLGWIRRKIGRG